VKSEVYRMRVLALDTTTRLAAVAIAEDGRVIVQEVGDPTRSHAEQLPSAVLRVVQRAGAAISTVDAFAVASGPGSFTGLRIGIATTQGLAVVTGRPVVALSALEALAQSAAVALPPGTIVGAWMDAHRREIFSALYRVGDAPPHTRERLIEIDPASVADPRATLTRWSRDHERPSLIVGDGAVAYADFVDTAITRIAPAEPLAGTLGLMALVRVASGESVGPAGVQPLYVRRPDAEIARAEARGPTPIG
jgi:tRNA threonylcarbamoyladenosine biosynthesis protein TsaB